MLSREDNDVLTRVGPDTPMGKLYRQFWLPALLSSELEGPDCAPVRLRILCEDLLAFRDSKGRTGVIGAYCPHRLAPLFFGRNEEEGLRCAYHGWKFDVQGNCVDLPNVESPKDEERLKKAARVGAYPTREMGGVVWVYMGPDQTPPDFPDLEWTKVPPGYRHLSRWIQRTNWAQGVEGEIDTAHVGFTHRSFVPSAAMKLTGATVAVSSVPRITLRETDYGFVYGARRRLDDGYYWRVTHWLAPGFAFIPLAPGDTFIRANARAWVPVDDNNSTTFNIPYRVDRPFNEEELEIFRQGEVNPPHVDKIALEMPNGYVIDTFQPRTHKGNDYLIDRNMQRTVNFTGLKGVNEQDRALQECMRSVGPDSPGIVDRTQEHLVASDAAVSTFRRVMLRMARDLEKGIRPVAVGRADLYDVRAISRINAIAEFDDFREQLSHALRAPPKGAALEGS